MTSAFHRRRHLHLSSSSPWHFATGFLIALKEGRKEGIPQIQQMADSKTCDSLSLQTSSCYLGNGSPSHGEVCDGSAGTPFEIATPELKALRILSQNLDALLLSSPSDFDCSDAQIIVEDRTVSVHRCILGARSPYFRQLFSAAGGASTLELKDLLTKWKVGYECLMTLLGYLYSGKIKPPPAGVCVCVDDTCTHETCRPAVDFALQLLYSSYVFQILELVSMSQRHLLEIAEKAQIEDIIPVLVVANECETGNNQLLMKCIEIVARSELDSTALEKEVPQHVGIEIFRLRSKMGLGMGSANTLHEKSIRRLQRALDSDDVELVGMLLNEGATTLDDAYALHYAVAYCDSKTTIELLELGLADINLRNTRGYTLLHVAAMRKEPAIIVALLTKGASPADETFDGRKALQIARRLTRAVDYYCCIVQGKESPKDRLCIEILEQAERRNPLLGEASLSLAVAGEDLRMKLIYLEIRVAFAKLLFPGEAKVAMDMARVDSTTEFTELRASKLAAVDLNENPFTVNQEHLARMKALSKTVELGKRYFPRCSEVLNKFMDDEISEITCLEKGTPEEQRIKRQRYEELKGDLAEAFVKDKEEFDKSGMSSSSSSSSKRNSLRHKNANK